MIKGLKGFFEEDVKAEAVDQDGNKVEADVVGKDGKPVKSVKTVLKTVLKVVVGTAAIAGTGVVSYIAGGKKVAKQKDAEIRKLQNDNYELSEELEEAYAKNGPQEEESEPDIEVTNF